MYSVAAACAAGVVWSLQLGAVDCLPDDPIALVADAAIGRGVAAADAVDAFCLLQCGPPIRHGTVFSTRVAVLRRMNTIDMPIATCSGDTPNT